MKYQTIQAAALLALSSTAFARPNPNGAGNNIKSGAEDAQRGGSSLWSRDPEPDRGSGPDLKNLADKLVAEGDMKDAVGLMDYGHDKRDPDNEGMDLKALEDVLRAGGDDKDAEKLEIAFNTAHVASKRGEKGSELSDAVTKLIQEGDEKGALALEDLLGAKAYYKRSEKGQRLSDLTTMLIKEGNVKGALALANVFGSKAHAERGMEGPMDYGHSKRDPKKKAGKQYGDTIESANPFSAEGGNHSNDPSWGKREASDDKEMPKRDEAFGGGPPPNRTDMGHGGPPANGTFMDHEGHHPNATSMDHEGHHRNETAMGDGPDGFNGTKAD